METERDEGCAVQSYLFRHCVAASISGPLRVFLLMCRRQDVKSALFRCSNQVEADLDNLKILLLLLLLQCTHYNSVGYSTLGSGRHEA